MGKRNKRKQNARKEVVNKEPNLSKEVVNEIPEISEEVVHKGPKINEISTVEKVTEPDVTEDTPTVGTDDKVEDTPVEDTDTPVEDTDTPIEHVETDYLNEWVPSSNEGLPNKDDTTEDDVDDVEDTEDVVEDDITEDDEDTEDTDTTEDDTDTEDDADTEDGVEDAEDVVEDVVDAVEDDVDAEEPTIEDKVNARQEDIIDNYVGPTGDVDAEDVERTVPEKYSLSHSSLAASVVDTVREFKRITDIRPFVEIGNKVVIKYQLSVLVKDLFKDPIAAKIAIINLVSDEELSNYIIALNQLTNQIPWKYNNDLLVTVDIFLNTVTIYDYKVKGVNANDTRPKTELFKTYLFKSGASKAVANTIAELVY